jgi:ABC-type polysaccharide/polyol phosphate export permease
MDLETIKESVKETQQGIKDRKQMLTKQDEKNKDVKQKSLTYNIVKYATAVSPIVIPFCLVYYFTQDLLMSFLATAFFVIILLICLVAYVMKKASESLNE